MPHQNVSAPLGTIVVYARDMQMQKTAAFYALHFGFKTTGATTDGLIELEATHGGAGMLIHQAAKSVKLGQVGVKLCFVVPDVAAFVAQAARQRTGTNLRTPKTQTRTASASRVGRFGRVDGSANQRRKHV